MPFLTSKFLISMALLAAAAMLLGTAWTSDDAFITLRVIDNFVNGYGLRFNADERVQVFTHPLWLMLLTPFYALSREAIVTTLLVSAGLSLGSLWLLAARIAQDVRYGCLLVLAAAASRTIYQYATSGLETPLTFLLLALLVWQLYRAEKKWIPAGIIGLLLLNRLDLAVLLGPVAAFLFFNARGIERVKIAVAAGLPALTWMVFSLMYYGAPFPNTAYAKLGTGYGTGDLILHGLEYTRDFALHDPLLVLIIGKAVFDVLRSQDWIARTLVSGVILYVAYIIIIGGDFMSGRFFAAPGFLALCLVARTPAPQWLSKRLNVAIVIGVGLVGILLAARNDETSISGPTGIADERRVYYEYTGLVPFLKAWREEGFKPVDLWYPWWQSGQVLKARAESAGMPIAAVEGAIGMTGYYAGPAVHIVDYLALSDAFLARLPAVPESRIGHYVRNIPAGYVDTVVNYPSPSTSVEALRPLLNDVTLATRAPLFSAGRWNAIWRLNSGFYNWILQSNIDYDPKVNPPDNPVAQ